jgi:ABC-type sugar transport system ATPase subunit
MQPRIKEGLAVNDSVQPFVQALAVDLPGSRRLGKVSLCRIAKALGQTQILKGIDLDITPGEFITVLGPSGCGKSTLLRIIAGLARQDSGTVAIDGQSVDGRPPDERDIAMVFQSYALYPHLTVAENIAVPLRMNRLNWLQRLPAARLPRSGYRRFSMKSGATWIISPICSTSNICSTASPVNCQEARSSASRSAERWSGRHAFF